MADGISFETRELAALEVGLSDHSARALGLASKVVRAAAYKVAADAQQLVPVDTGATRNSIHVTAKTLEADIGPTTSYAGFLEFGTSRMTPRPFMGPALDRQTPGFIAAIAAIPGLL